MPTTYTKATSDELIHAQIRQVLRAWHPELVEVKVTVDVLWAANEEDQPLKQRGYPCAALVKKTSLNERANGASDILLIIDSVGFEALSDTQQLALLDHELEHLWPVPDNSEGATKPYKYDDLDRPKLRTAPHDFESAGFYSVVKRHRQGAGEYRQLESIRRVFAQQELPFPETEGAPA